jgi:hypothetical protein
MWKQVVGFEGFYEVSDTGIVRSVRRSIMRHKRSVVREGKVLTPRLHQFKYLKVSLSRKNVTYTRLIHRLVLEAFIGPCPSDMECCHNDGNASNNRIDNLRWDSHRANMSDQTLHETSNRGERHGRAKLTEDQIFEIKRRLKAGELQREIAFDFEVSGPTVSRIKSGHAWSFLT